MEKLYLDFPFLKNEANGKRIIYLDNGATSQKPQKVIDAIVDFYTHHNNNIHRSLYAQAEETTRMYENVRAKVAAFINANPDEIVFSPGATAGINFIASTWAATHIKKDDEILLTQMEHHSNMIPWQHVAKANGAHLKYIPVLPDGQLDLSSLSEFISPKTKLVSVVHTSNALGTTNDIQAIISAAKKVNAKVLIDAAQSVSHQPLDVKKIGCDFLVFSGHKMLGPTGIGVLYIKKELHDQIPPYQYGGGMIKEADFENGTWQPAPHKFEAGTPPLAAVMGLGAAIDYYTTHIDWKKFQTHQASLCALLIAGLSKLQQVKILGPIDQLVQKGHLVSFVIEEYHAHDVAAYLSTQGICVRAGNHCAQPLAKKLGIPVWVRASFHVYNSPEDVEKLLKAITLLVVK